MSDKAYVLRCRWCPHTVTIRGRNGHGAAYERLESHVHYAHSKESAVLDASTDYSNEGYREDERQQVREERLIREGVRPIPVPED